MLVYYRKLGFLSQLVLLARNCFFGLGFVGGGGGGGIYFFACFSQGLFLVHARFSFSTDVVLMLISISITVCSLSPLPFQHITFASVLSAKTLPRKAC